jgi:hypothetical protein
MDYEEKIAAPLLPGMPGEDGGEKILKWSLHAMLYFSRFTFDVSRLASYILRLQTID